nr:modulator protein [Escherichia coli]
MLEQHQDSLLPRVTQGEEGHETAEKRPDLVFINRVLHIVNIHVSDPESFM